MQIEIGKRYDNKTWRFLFPCLRGHGDIFASKINPLYKLAVGVYDYTLKDQTKFNGRNIFILLDMYSQNKLCTDFIEFVKYQSYYVTHYCPDSDFGNSRKMMIVISIPERFEPAYDAFIRGKYSEMYNEEEERFSRIAPMTIFLSRDNEKVKVIERSSFMVGTMPLEKIEN